MCIFKDKDQNEKYPKCSAEVERRSLTFLPDPSTESIHGAEERSKPENSLTIPTFQTSTYAFKNMDEVHRFAEGEIEREEYGRYGNPTQKAAENKVANLEGGDSALMFSSGMAAITTTLLGLLKKGDHAVFIRECYKRTRQFARELLPNLGIETTLVKAVDFEDLNLALRDSTKLIFTESPTNPLLKVVDFRRLAEIGGRRGVLTIVDSTFATPFNQRPLQLGIDLVIHSGTKYLGGHNDLLAGFLVGSADLVSKVEDMRAYLGAVPDPHSAYLLIRGLKTLALRMKQHNENALQVAQFLESCPQVDKVYYPGLESHPQHQVVEKQMRGYGGVVSFELKGEVTQFLEALQISYIASSFGGVESLIEHVPVMSYYHYTEEERKGLGIKDNLIRFSVGIEDREVLIKDIREAL